MLCGGGEKFWVIMWVGWFKISTRCWESSLDRINLSFDARLIWCLSGGLILSGYPQQFLSGAIPTPKHHTVSIDWIPGFFRFLNWVNKTWTITAQTIVKNHFKCHQTRTDFLETYIENSLLKRLHGQDMTSFWQNDKYLLSSLSLHSKVISKPRVDSFIND